MTAAHSNTFSDFPCKETLVLLRGTPPTKENSSSSHELRQLLLRRRSSNSYELLLRPLLANGSFSPSQKELIGSWLLEELASGSMVTISGFGIAGPALEVSLQASSEPPNSP